MCCCIHAPGSRSPPSLPTLLALTHVGNDSFIWTKQVLARRRQKHPPGLLQDLCYSAHNLETKELLGSPPSGVPPQFLRFPYIPLCPWMYAEFQWLGDARRTPSLSDAQQFGPHLSSSGVIDANRISNIFNICSWIWGFWLRCAWVKLLGTNISEMSGRPDKSVTSEACWCPRRAWDRTGTRAAGRGPWDHVRR